MEITRALLFSTLCTFLMSCAGQDTSVRRPEFVTHPKEYSYLLQNQPVTLTCEAYDAVEITFNCLGTKMDTARQTTYQSYEPDTDRVLVKTSMDVDYRDVQGLEDYWCECLAWASSESHQEGEAEPRQYWLSRRGFVMTPYIEKEFLAEPESQTVVRGAEVALRCVPPRGNPEPRIVWNKNGVRINPHEDSNLQPTKYGTLIITNFQTSDEGIYTCEAKNLAGQRESRAAKVTIRDYAMSETHLFSDELSDEPASGAFFEENPKSVYYVSDRTDMTCTVRGANILEFRCNGARMDKNKLTEDPQSRPGPNGFIRTTYTATAEEITAFKTQYNMDYSCLCYAWYMVDQTWKGVETSASRFIVTEKTTEAPAVATTTQLPGSSYFSVQPEEQYYTFSKKPAVVKCTFTGASIMTVRCNGVRMPQNRVEIKQDYNRETNVRTLSATVEITTDEVKKYAEEENDDFTCLCVGWYTKPDTSWGTVESTEATVVIGYLDSKFIVEPSDMTMSAGRTVVFDCVPPLGGPEPSVYWSKDGIDVDTSDQRFEMTEDGGLTIFDITLEDAGNYKCVAENDAGMETSKAAKLVVEGEGGGSTDTVVIMEPETEAPEPETTFMPETTTISDFEAGIPIFIKMPAEVTYITRNKPAVITCRTLGAEHLIFECNGKRIPEGIKDSQLVIDPETNKKVLQRSITVTRKDYDAAEDVDTYSCTCSAWYSDMVNQKWSQLHRNGTVDLAFIRKTFQEAPTSQKVQAGSSVEFMCKAPKSKPKSKVSWEKDGEAIRPNSNENIMMSESGNLLINSVSKADIGNYTCVAENVAGTRSASAELSLEEVDSVISVVNEAPEFVVELDDTNYVVADGSVTLTCGASNTGKITFSCNQEEVDESLITLEKTEVNGQMILQASYDIEGSMIQGLSTAYTCECLAWYKLSENELAKYVSSTSGYVEMAYIEDTFQREPQSKTAMVGQMVTFKCVLPGGFPRPQASWSKNGEQIDLLSSGDLIMPSDGSLVIVQARLSDTGFYSCTATNIAGTRTSGEAELMVKELETTSMPEPEPETTAEMSAVNVTDDETYIVTSEVTPTAEDSTPMEGNVTNTTLSSHIGGDGDGDVDTTGEPVPEATAPPEINTAYCHKLLDQCNSYDASQTCLKIHLDCSEMFLKQCQGVLSDAVIAMVESILYKCTGDSHMNEVSPGEDTATDDDCKIRKKCLEPFKPNQEMFSIHDSCGDLQEFLKCVHDVKVRCNGLNDMEQKLTDIADWFMEFCSRIPRKERIVGKCATYNSCPAPIVPETTLNDLIDYHFWCKYIKMTTECRKLSLADSECKTMKKGELKMNLHFLETKSAKFCMEDPVPELTDAPPVRVDTVGSDMGKDAGSSTSVSMLVSIVIQFLAVLVVRYR